MTGERVHAFTDDVLGDHDGVAIAELIRTGEVSAVEVAEAAIARAERVNPVLNAVVHPAYDRARAAAAQPADGPLSGVPTFVKDNTDVAGMPSGHGSGAFRPVIAAKDGPYARQYLSAGFTVLGKSALPEFGFNASTEFMDGDPTRNPWHTDYSTGASSGGAAALVAAGVVPIAHANDGGGSIRIPAACCGLVGLKPTRGRHLDSEMSKSLPIRIVSEGVVTRSVRDTAVFTEAVERHWRNAKLPPVGLVEGPSGRRLRIGLLTESVGVATVDAQTSAAVNNTATMLEKLGHHVDPVALPVTDRFVSDFVAYWGMLSFLTSTFGKRAIAKDFDASKLDGLSQGLLSSYRRVLHKTPATLYRLSRVRREYTRMFARHDVVLLPVLAHTTPRLGHLSPTVPYDELIERLKRYVAFTPLHNVAGAPAISLPLGETDAGLPIGVQFSGSHGDERTLLELAFELEAEQPFRRIQD